MNIPEGYIENTIFKVIYDERISLDEIERQYIVLALRAHKGNRYRAAMALRISRETLKRKMRIYGIYTEKIAGRPSERQTTTKIERAEQRPTLVIPAKVIILDERARLPRSNIGL